MCYKNIHKDVQIPVQIYQRTKKVLCYSSTKNDFKMEFGNNLWLPYIDQPQYDNQHPAH